MLAHFPEAEQSGAQAQAPFGVASFGEPVEGGAKIVVFEFETIQPLGVAGADIFGSAFFGENQTVGGVGAPCERLFSAGGHFFEAILANGFEHEETRFAVGLFDLADQAFVHHGRHSIEDVEAEIFLGVADGLDGFESAATEESGEPAEEFLFRFVEEIVAPIDGVAKGLLASGEIASAAGEELQTTGEPGAQGRRREELDAGGGEFDGERKTIQASANFGDGGGVFFGEFKIGFDGRRRAARKGKSPGIGRASPEKAGIWNPANRAAGGEIRVRWKHEAPRGW